MTGCPPCGHMRSPVPADPEDDIIIISSDESPGDGPEQQAKNKRVQKTEALGDVKAGMCPSYMDTGVSV